VYEEFNAPQRAFFVDTSETSALVVRAAQASSHPGVGEWKNLIGVMMMVAMMMMIMMIS
jgi:hypothetical protein